jgi:hypothetical protein
MSPSRGGCGRPEWAPVRRSSAWNCSSKVRHPTPSGDRCDRHGVRTVADGPSGRPGLDRRVAGDRRRCSRINAVRAGGRWVRHRPRGAVLGARTPDLAGLARRDPRSLRCGRRAGGNRPGGDVRPVVVVTRGGLRRRPVARGPRRRRGDINGGDLGSFGDLEESRSNRGERAQQAPHFECLERARTPTGPTQRHPFRPRGGAAGQYPDRSHVHDFRAADQLPAWGCGGGSPRERPCRVVLVPSRSRRWFQPRRRWHPCISRRPDRCSRFRTPHVDLEHSYVTLFYCGRKASIRHRVHDRMARRPQDHDAPHLFRDLTSTARECLL